MICTCALQGKQKKMNSRPTIRGKNGIPFGNFQSVNSEKALKAQNILVYLAIRPSYSGL